MYQHKLAMWQRQYATIIDEEDYVRDVVLATVAIHEFSKKKKYNKKRYWVRPLLRQRKNCGFYYTLFSVISLCESDFRFCFRMSKAKFEELIVMVAPKMTKQDAIREAIPAIERLCITIRFLAFGDSMSSLFLQCLVGLTTVAKIIGETCEAIWSSLVRQELPGKLTPTNWLKIAGEFNHKWNFPNCIGAIDGEHITIQCPNNAGSAFFNYKHSYSIILLGICDANYKFPFVDIGAYGRRSDGGVFRDSLMGRKFNAGLMNLPAPKPLSPGRAPMPYVLVGDEAFQLTDYCIRPYPGKEGIDQNRNIFNYRLSRARRTIENTFGILVNRWRIFHAPIICSVKKCISIVKATVVLHNWLRQEDEEADSDSDDSNSDDSDSENERPNDVETIIDRSRVSVQDAKNMRDEFCCYFNCDGAVHWQFDHR